MVRLRSSSRCGRSRESRWTEKGSCSALARRATSRLTCSRSSRRTRASRSTRLDWRPTEHSSSRSNAQACIPCLARRQCWRDGLLLQASPTTNGNGTRTNHGRKRPCACATAKKLAPISREERAERRATGDVPARPQEPGRTRRMCGNPACHAGSTNENAQLRTVGR